MRVIAASGAKVDVRPLPEILHNGLLAPGIIGLSSVIATSLLISFLLFRLYQWKKEHKSVASYNQYIFLILNLLVADLLQALAFCLSFHWRKLNAIIHDDPICFTQGWFLNLGDTASGLFVFFIAAHTFWATIKGHRPGHRLFFTLIGCTWFFCLLVTALGPIIHHDRYFTQAGAWCWAAARWETERLLFHYVWVFVVEFGTVLTYLAVFIYLKRSVGSIRRTSIHTNVAATTRIDRAAKLMIIYPISYVLLTLPLSAGRMWSMAHKGQSLPPAYAIVAGSLMTSTGLVDTLLYSLTRRALISSSPASDRAKSYMSDPNDTRRKDDFPSLEADLDTKPLAPASSAPVIKQTRTVTIDADNLKLNRCSSSVLPEELAMAFKQAHPRPAMRSYHSHDPRGGVTPRGVSFPTLVSPSGKHSLMIPGQSMRALAPLPPLPLPVSSSAEVGDEHSPDVKESDSPSDEKSDKDEL